MNDSGQSTNGRVNLRHRRALLVCSLVTLHLTAIAGGFFCFTYTDGDANWAVPLLIGAPAAVVSLAAIGFTRGGPSLGMRITLAVFTPIATWLVILMLAAKMSPYRHGVAMIVIATIVNMAFLTQAVLMTLPLAWRNRRRQRAFAAHDREQAGRQFGLRHIMLWTLLTAAVLTALRTVTWSDWSDYSSNDLSDLLDASMIYIGLGAIHAGTGLGTFACLGLRSTWRSARLVVVMTIAFTAASLVWIVIWTGGYDGVAWAFSLPVVVHVVLLSTTIVLLRLAEYRFTRSGGIPAEATTP